MLIFYYSSKSDISKCHELLLQDDLFKIRGIKLNLIGRPHSKGKNAPQLNGKKANRKISDNNLNLNTI